MKAAVTAVILFCIALIGIGYYFATRDTGAGPRLIALDPAYAAKQERGGWTKGPDTAKVTILEYADFQCVPCRPVATMIHDVLSANPDTVRLEYRHYPLDGNNKAIQAAVAAEAAGRQGKFWEMHQLLYGGQSDWINQSQADFAGTLEAYAKQIGLNPTQFNTDLDDPSIRLDIEKSVVAAQNASIESAPGILINGKKFDQREVTTESLSQAVKAAMTGQQ